MSREVELIDVILDEVNGARAVLRLCNGHGLLQIPLPPLEATLLSCVLQGLPIDAASGHANWHDLYLTTLSLSGLELRSVELDLRAERYAAAVHLSASLSQRSSVAAPVEAALVLALASGAPMYATLRALTTLQVDNVEPMPALDPASSPAGDAFLATLLASLPDEDFGERH